MTENTIEKCVGENSELEARTLLDSVTLNLNIVDTVILQDILQRIIENEDVPEGVDSSIYMHTLKKLSEALAYSKSIHGCDSISTGGKKLIIPLQSLTDLKLTIELSYLSFFVDPESNKLTFYKPD